MKIEFTILSLTPPRLLESFMSKRKVIAGGYEDSSDGPELELDSVADEPSKRARSVSYAPVRLTTMSKTASFPFQLPQLPARSVSNPTISQQIKSNPSSQSELVALDPPTSGSGSQPLADPKAIAGNDTYPKAINVARAPSTDAGPTFPKASQGRSTIALERQLNEMTERLTDYMGSKDAQHQETQEMLARVLEAVNRMASAGSPAYASGATPSQSTIPAAPIISDSNALRSNPRPTPELANIVAKVVSEARNRVGKKKGGAEDNSLKEHARVTFYRMLGITAAKEIPPHYEDEYGEPDTLPKQFIDPDTGYCRPCPHWEAAPVKQIAWIPTYLERFFATIPNDGSELATTLRSLTVEQVVILLIDGPFKTARASWRDMKKSDEEVKAMRKYHRGYQRTERKAISRGRFIKKVPSLQGAEWEFLSHAGYMSANESDDEGGILTKRPEYRPQWVTNLFEAIRMALLETARSQPGLCPRPPRRRVVITKLPVPHLERGTGSGKFVVRIALCGISKSWREANAGELQNYTQSINFKAVEKPDICSFLAEHPLLDDDGSDHDYETASDSDRPRPVFNFTVESGQGLSDSTGESKGKNVDHGCSADGGELRLTTTAGWGSEDEEDFTAAINDSLATDDDAGASTNHHIPDSQIDPTLLSPPTGDGLAPKEKNRMRPKMRQAPDDTRSTPTIESTHQTPEAVGSEPGHNPPYYPPMPPPPLPQPVSSNGSSSATQSEGTVDAPPRRSSRNSTSGKDATLTQGGYKAPGSSAVLEPILNVPPVRKRRGRPPGSKNKPKE
ncbi:hypothetical protein FRC12_006749 [Ceratobasidium sp. 428]|nr:hypothetical protein FRC12_006749 [Ceratobasidium sp. 428]